MDVQNFRMNEAFQITFKNCTHRTVGTDNHGRAVIKGWEENQEIIRNQMD